MTLILKYLCQRILSLSLQDAGSRFSQEVAPGDSLLEDFQTFLIFDKVSPAHLQLFTTAHGINIIIILITDSYLKNFVYPF